MNNPRNWRVALGVVAVSEMMWRMTSVKLLMREKWRGKRLKRRGSLAGDWCQYHSEAFIRHRSASYAGIYSVWVLEASDVHKCSDFEQDFTKTISTIRVSMQESWRGEGHA